MDNKKVYNKAKHESYLNTKRNTPKVVNLINKKSNNITAPTGSPTGICSICGKIFEQQYHEDGNRYSNFKTCHACRKKISEKKEKKIKEKETSVAVLPFNPHPWQAKAFEDFKTHRFNLWACGNRCLLKGAFIQGCNKSVEDVIVGDTVFSQNGKEQKVIAIGHDTYKGNIYHIKATGCLETICNEEHPFLVCDILIDPDKRDEMDRYILSKKFIKAKHIQYQTYQKKKHGLHIRKYLKLPKISKTVSCTEWKIENVGHIQLTEDFAWLCGLYCAEGCLCGRQAKWTLNVYNTQLIEKTYNILKKIGLHVGKAMDKKHGVCRLVISNYSFSKLMCEKIGRYSINKHIPEDILFNKNEKILISFLKGYFSGDGWYDKKRQSLTASTVSKRLSLEIQMAGIRLGGFFSINYYKREKSKNADYKIFCSNACLIKKLGYTVLNKREHTSIIKIEDDFYCPLQTDTKPEYRECEIYYFSTEDGTFIHNNQVNHNSGKDFAANMIGISYFVECLNENRHIEHPEMAPSVLWWIVAPTEAMAKQNWRDLKKQFPKDWIVALSNSTMTIETIGGGIIEVRSAYDPESLVGVGIDLVTITEAARIADLDIVWANLEARLGSPGRGLAKDRKGKQYGQGKAIINSTPIGKNYFYEMWKWGQKGSDTYSSAWISYQLPWTCNPANKELANTIVQTKYGEISYEEDMRRRMGDRLFRQNYLADFLAMDGTVFKDFEEKCVQNLFNLDLSKKQQEEYAKEWATPIPYHTYRIGYDPATGSSADSPAVVVRDMNTNNIVLVVDMYGKNYDMQWDEIAYISKLYNYASCCWLRTGHTAIENQLAKRGVVEIPLEEMGGRKAEYIQSLERAIQNQDVHVLSDGTATIQKLILQMADYTEKAGKYSNERQPHDDFVSACYAAWHDYSTEQVKQYYCPLMGYVNRMSDY